MIVGKYMTREIISLKPDASLHDARRLMKSNRIRHIPVVSDEEKLVGIISDRDIRRFTPTPIGVSADQEDEEFMKSRKVEEAMAKHAITANFEMPLEDAATLMRDEKIGALPVIGDGRLTGIICHSDIFNAFTDMIRLLKKKGIKLEDYYD